MVILGIDPGYAIVGYGAVETVRGNNRMLAYSHAWKNNTSGSDKCFFSNFDASILNHIFVFFPVLSKRPCPTVMRNKHDAGCNSAPLS